jgi:protein SCO1/2
MTRRCFAAAALAATACSSRREPFQTFNTVPDFSLTDQNGNPFTFSGVLRGKVWVADFIFTTCNGPCPRMSSQMRQVQAGVESNPDIHLVSFTVDPVNDTPPALAAYAKRWNAIPGRWHFLTGARETLHQLARETFMLGNVDGNLDHSTRFILIDRAGVVRRYYDTTEPNIVRAVIADARELAQN